MKINLSVKKVSSRGLVYIDKIMGLLLKELTYCQHALAHILIH